MCATAPMWCPTGAARSESADRLRGALLTDIACRCVEEKLGRLEWSVLDWSENAIGFYQSTGARVMEEWRICRLHGDALRAFATNAS